MGSDDQQDGEDWRPQCEYLYDDSRKGDENDRCNDAADAVIRPKNPQTMVHFGRGLMCHKHAAKCVEDAEGSRDWEIEKQIESPADLEPINLEKSHPNDRGPFMS